MAAIAIPRLTGFQDTAKINADKATFASLQSAVAIGVASGDISDGTVQLTVTAATGAIATTPADLLEANAFFKTDANKALGTGIKWTVADGEITVAPVIDNTTGAITMP